MEGSRPRVLMWTLAIGAGVIGGLVVAWATSGDLRNASVVGVAEACTQDPRPSCGRVLDVLCWARAADACRWVAEAERCGRGRPVDFERALAGYVRACDLGNPRACSAAAEEFAAPASRLRSNVTASDAVRWQTALGLAMSGAWDEALALRPPMPDPRFTFLEASRALDAGDQATAREAIARVRDDVPDDRGVLLFERLLAEEDSAEPWRVRAVRAWLAAGRPTHADSPLLAPVGLMPDGASCYAPFPRAERSSQRLSTREEWLGAIAALEADEPLRASLLAFSRAMLKEGDFAERWIAAAILDRAVREDGAQGAALREELFAGLRLLGAEAEDGDPYFTWWRQRLEPADRAGWTPPAGALGSRRVEVYRAFLRGRTADGRALAVTAAFSATVSVVATPSFFEFSKELRQRAEDPGESDAALFVRRVCVLGDTLASAPWLLEQFTASAVLRSCDALGGDPEAAARADRALARARAVSGDGNLIQALHQVPLPTRFTATLEDVVRGEMNVYEELAAEVR